MPKVLGRASKRGFWTTFLPLAPGAEAGFLEDLVGACIIAIRGVIETNVSAVVPEEQAGITSL
jgi:hypothetical protein